MNMSSNEVTSKTINSATEIVKITPVQPVFAVTWQITNRCNYDCMYCDVPMFHVTKDVFLKTHEKSLLELKNNWLHIYNQAITTDKKIKMSITGGEPTLNKNLLPFFQWLRDNYNNKIDSMGITSNGSASLTTYKKLYSVLDWISISLHTEHVDIDNFLKKMLPLGDFISNTNKTLHLNLMDVYWLTPEIKDYLTSKLSNQQKIFYTFNKVVYEDRQHRNYPIFLYNHEHSKFKFNFDTVN